MPRGRPKKTEDSEPSTKIFRLPGSNYGIGVYSYGWIARQYYVTQKSHFGEGGVERFNDTYHGSFVSVVNKITDLLFAELVENSLPNVEWEKVILAWSEAVKHIIEEAAKLENKGLLKGIKKEFEDKVPKVTKEKLVSDFNNVLKRVSINETVGGKTRGRKKARKVSKR